MSFLLFVLAALLIALSPGPGIFYVAARTLTGGRAEGLASSFGAGVPVLKSLLRREKMPTPDPSLLAFEP